MKIRLIIALSLLTALPFCNAWGQVQTTGHIFAEVVEFTDAGFNGESQFQISQNEYPGSLNLGSFNISARPQLLCTYCVKPGIVKNDNGEEFIVHTISNQAQGFITTNEKGNQELALSANANNLPIGGQYSGNYNITFAYN
ncbi:MAG: hypothetical protein RBS07_04790 [Lentimicrobium sp.]|jgi:hypothetical protein|nr:hypothetical protein [Lentimicrobium sp.]